MDLTANEITTHNAPRQTIAPDTSSDITLPASPASDAFSTSRLPGAIADQYSLSHTISTPPELYHGEHDSEYTLRVIVIIVLFTITTTISREWQSQPSHTCSFFCLPPTVTGGESLYRTIMNRSTEFEAGYTLHARHLEERTAGMRYA
jgi:hypothetical protein